MAETRSGYLTIFAPNRAEIYGEFADGVWQIDRSGGVENHTFLGAAGDGTADTFRRLNEEGISHVEYLFECEGFRYSGEAQLLRPEEPLRGQLTIRVETIETPLKE